MCCRLSPSGFRPRWKPQLRTTLSRSVAARFSRASPTESCRQGTLSRWLRWQSHSSRIVTAPRTTTSTNGVVEELFNYTSGRWTYNDEFQRARRYRHFVVDELKRLAAESVGRRAEDVISFTKLAEGGFNRIFRVVMRDGFQMVARIPYPMTVPKYYVVASEVATANYLRSHGFPVPKIYAYSPSPDNPAQVEYIFMEFVQGIQLSDIWYDLTEAEIISVTQQLVKVESSLMALTFPAGGSIYHTADLEAPRDGTSAHRVPLVDGQFSMGPDTSLVLWHGRRAQLAVYRGPYLTPEAVLTDAGMKESAYLQKFGQPLQPYQRQRREAFEYQRQDYGRQLRNLQKYLQLTPQLIPHDAGLDDFCLRHSDLQPSNVMITRDPTTSLISITGIIDWQHTSVLPITLAAGVPTELQGPNGEQVMTKPAAPDDLEALKPIDRDQALEHHRLRLVNYHYLAATKQYNPTHFYVLAEPRGSLRRRLFRTAGGLWDGDNHPLELALIRSAKNWDMLTHTEDALCPIEFSAEEVQEAERLDKEQIEAEEVVEGLRDILGCGPDGWVPTDRYEKSLAMSKQFREAILKAMAEEDIDAKVQMDTANNWPFDDMDEEPYT